MNKPSASPRLKGRPLTEQIILFFSFGCGSGFLKPAPGTWGTLPGLVLAWILMPHPFLHLTVLISVTLIGIWLCSRSSEILGVHDHGGIVIDEIAGILLTCLFFEPTALTLCLAFIWFRIFDIVKPWPIRWIDNTVHGGFGIMVDDLVAGVFAWFALWVSISYLQ